ncbi:MAG: hypothetical protein WCK90_04520 [archaeon]
MRSLFLFIFFLLLGAFYIMSQQNLDVSMPNDFSKFAESYYSWFWHLGENGAKTVGYVVGIDWVPKNQTG